MLAKPMDYYVVGVAESGDHSTSLNQVLHAATFWRSKLHLTV